MNAKNTRTSVPKVVRAAKIKSKSTCYDVKQTSIINKIECISCIKLNENDDK